MFLQTHPRGGWKYYLAILASASADVSEGISADMLLYFLNIFNITNMIYTTEFRHWTDIP